VHLVGFIIRIYKFEKLVHLVGFIIRIYHDTRSSERQLRKVTNRDLCRYFLF
jgi:hypothetical protein